MILQQICQKVAAEHMAETSWTKNNIDKKNSLPNMNWIEESEEAQTKNKNKIKNKNQR